MGNARSRSEGDCEWDKTYKEIKTHHDEAYRCIDNAITLEEEERALEALEKYKLGISIIDKVLNIHVECPEKTDETWEEACRMIQKMKRTRAELIKRISSIQSASEPQPSTSSGNVPAAATPMDPPPSYEEAMSESSSTTPQTYSELASALENLKIEPNNDTKELTLIYSQDNVRVYFISPDGTVVSFENLLTLKIYIVAGEKKNPNDPDGFMEISEWIYPLIPGVSPCFKSEFGALIVPDTNAPVPGSAIGIVLPPEADIQALLNLLDDIIYGVVSAEPGLGVPKVAYSTVPSRTRRELPRTPYYSSTISHGIVNGAWYMREGLIKGAQAASSLISYGTPKLISKIRPADEPTEINPKLTKGLQTAKNVTGTAVSVTGFVAGKVGCATMALGRYLAPHIQKQGTKLLTSQFNMDQESAHEKVDSVLNVAAGAVEGIATVYSGLEQSSKILGESITQNTVKIVEHKYGPEAGELTGDSIYTMGNMYNFTSSMKFFKPSSLAKTTMKSAGKGFLEDFKEHHITTHEGYSIPDLSAFSTHIQNLNAEPSTSINKN